MIGFKVVEQIVTVSPHAGLVFGVGGTATTKVLASGVTSEDTFTMAISYVAGVQTIVNLKGLQIGADAGYFMINDQKLDATDFSFNLGGYARGLLGMKF